MNNWFKNLGGAVVAALLSSGVTMYAVQHTNTTLIMQLTDATKNLSLAVTELRVTVAAQNERFVTKDELYNRLKDFKKELN